MTPAIIIGVDPGVTTGVAILEIRSRGIYEAGSLFFHTDPQSLTRIMTVLTHGYPDAWLSVATEDWAESSIRTGRAGAVTRDVLGMVIQWAAARGAPVVSRRAVDVKPWASDKRIRAAGLWERTRLEGGHARDAARHALFHAVRVGVLRDPLLGPLTEPAPAPLT